MRPANYREWVFLSSSLGLTYQPAAGAPASSAGPQFQNVFVNRSSYRGFMQTGKWPDKTIFVLEFRQSAVADVGEQRREIPAGLAGIEAEVKDSRFPDGWAFYAFDQTAPPNGVAPLAGDRVARCIECHTQHTAVERTFVQFYPTLFEVAKRLRERSSPTTPIPSTAIATRRTTKSRSSQRRSFVVFVTLVVRG